MSSPDTWYAYFHVRGEFDPDDVTRSLGVAPSETGREGDPLPRTSVRRNASIWALHSRAERTEPIHLHVEDVLDQMDTNEPGVHFDKETVERIAAYSLSIDCDFYIRR